MSLTIQGWIIGLLVFLANHFGLPFTEAELTTTVSVIVGLISFIMIYWGRYRKGDINVWGGRDR
jgi:hypothetical protein